MTFAKRKGITITEALASIAVASVGLFAVLAVIPFAARQAQVGLDLDFAVAAGKNGFHEFENREMGNVNRWLIGYSEATGDVDTDGDGNPETFGPDGLNADNFDPNRFGRAVLIDPLFLTANQDLLQGLVQGDDDNRIDHFPMVDFDPADPDPDGCIPDRDFMGNPSGYNTTSDTINRLNLSTTCRKGNKPSAGWTDTYRVPYGNALAERIFRDANDLTFVEPIDKLEFPIQKYKLPNPALLESDPANNPPVIRQSAGKISWMVMLVPEAAHRHLYRAYFIVFKNRVLRYQTNAAGDIIGEIVYRTVTATSTDVDGTPQQGRGGGEFELSDREGAFPVIEEGNSLATDNQQTLKPGNWICLFNSTENFYRWYQISRIDNTNAPDCTVTLSGPDVDADALTNGTLKAIAPIGVIGVFEKTIRIEDDSIWNN